MLVSLCAQCLLLSQAGAPALSPSVAALAASPSSRGWLLAQAPAAGAEGDPAAQPPPPPPVLVPQAAPPGAANPGELDRAVVVLRLERERQALLNDVPGLGGWITMMVVGSLFGVATLGMAASGSFPINGNQALGALVLAGVSVVGFGVAALGTVMMVLRAIRKGQIYKRIEEIDAELDRIVTFPRRAPL